MQEHNNCITDSLSDNTLYPPTVTLPESQLNSIRYLQFYEESVIYNEYHSAFFINKVITKERFFLLIVEEDFAL